MGERKKKKEKKENHYIEAIKKEKEIIKRRNQIENWDLKVIIIKRKTH